MKCFTKVKFLFCSVLVGVGAFMFSGCGSGTTNSTPSTEQLMKVSGKEELKKRLVSTSESGAGGSGLAGIREAITELKASDAALAEQLMQDLSQLEQLNDATQIKELAAKMAAKL